MTSTPPPFQHTETLKDLIGPVYLSEDVSHKFSVVPPRVEAPRWENKLLMISKATFHRDVSGPVYLTEEARHKYGEFIKQVEGKSLYLLVPYWIS